VRRAALRAANNHKSTLTNGYASPEQAAIEFRVRGGNRTVDALLKAVERGFHVFVVTARGARELILETLMHSFSPEGSLRELGPVFASSLGTPFVTEVVGDATLGRVGKVYASDYRKPAAIEHICSLLGTEGARYLYFFDDFVGNAFDVAHGTYPIPVVAAWWDPFEEEQLGSMTPMSASGTDCSYKVEYAAYLEAFGVTATLARERLAFYAAKNAADPERDITTPPPPPKKLGNLAKFGALEGLLKHKGAEDLPS